MEIELPDPASIWKELGEFQSAVDSYVKQQGDLADRFRRTHLEFCQEQKSQLDIIEQQKKKTLHEIDILAEEKQREKDELERMRKKNNLLKREAEDLPIRLEEHKVRDEEQRRRTSQVALTLEKKERLHRLEVQEKRAHLEAFQRALGLTIKHKSNGHWHFLFTHVDEMDLAAQFEFVVEPSGDDLESLAFVSCTPPLECASALVNAYNHSESHERLSTLVRLFRREFLALVRAKQVDKPQSTVSSNLSSDGNSSHLKSI